MLVYDADCGFCRWSLARVLALDPNRRLQPVKLGSTQADAVLADLSASERAASWHLISPDGARASAGAAAAPLLRLLSGGRLPAALLAATPALTDRSYRWVADHRSALSRALPAGAKQRAAERIRRHAV
jgi:predicted DCC family thiol-disulfide oxidoreductase YuxK